MRFWSCPHSRHRHGTTPHLTEYSRSGHKHVKKSCPRWGSNPRLQDSGADALPAEPRLQLILLSIIAECYRCAAMRLTANYNVALSASTLAAQQPPTSRPALVQALHIATSWLKDKQLCRRTASLQHRVIYRLYDTAEKIVTSFWKIRKHIVVLDVCFRFRCGMPRHLLQKWCLA